jgi:signal transduction histidine kinase
VAAGDVGGHGGVVVAPSLDQLDRLVGKFRDAGLTVDVQTEGEATPLPPGLDLTAYRLIQEGLTNALKHAHAGSVVVRLRYGPDCLALSVRDDGRGPDPGAVPGNGLLGMRERVSVYGGSLSAGAADGGGFELAAQLPVEASA